MRDRLRIFLRQQLESRGQAPEFGDRDSLFLSGKLDSVAAVQLLVFLETELKWSGSAKVNDLSQIDSVEKIIALVE